MSGTLFYSVRTRQMLAEAAGSVALGVAHYSYSIVCTKFLQALVADGWEPVELVRPEIYPDARYVAGTEPGRKPVHLIFKPFDEIRILKGAHNIAIVFWEMEQLPTEDRLPAAHPRRLDLFNDYVHCLKLVDEVWVSCEFTRTVLMREGVNNVFVVPTPIAPQTDGRTGTGPDETSSRIEMTDASRASQRLVMESPRLLRPAESLFFRMERARSNGGRILATVFNPHDSRKNPAAMLLGFQFAAGRKPADLLVVKLVVDGDRFPLSAIFKHSIPGLFGEYGQTTELLDCAAIVVVSGHLTDGEMEQLWGAADFYLCASSAEGQNLPLLESMAHGVVPISTASTAMADYVSADNAFVVPTRREPVVERLTTAYGLSRPEWDVADPRAVAGAIKVALDAGEGEMAAKRDAARLAVVGRYAPDVVARAVRQRLASAPEQPRLKVGSISSP